MLISLPSSFTPEGQRQFKLGLGISGEEGFAKQTGTDSSQNWTIQKNWFQGIDVGRLAGLFTDNKKSIYKLVLNNVTVKDTQSNVEEREIKGALGLVRATWGGEEKNGYRWEVQNVKVDEQNKVWLIMAQGKNAMYLMPTVRTSGWCGWWGEGEEKGLLEKRKQAKEEVGSKGVSDISEWTKKFNTWRDRETIQDAELKKAMSSGFSITRKIEAIVFGGGVFSSEDAARKMKEELERFQRESKDYNFTGAGKIDYLYKNAGELNVWEKGIGEHSYCSKRIAYFPLDLVILSKSGEDVKPEISNNGKDQTIKITDKIEQVIGVRLDPINK